MRLSRLLLRLIACAYIRPHRYCCVCESFIGRFLPYRGGSLRRPPLMVALDVIGSDVDNFSCPKCGCHDRERHLFLYLRRMGILERFHGGSILHFAPEPWLRVLIERQNPAIYIRADYSPAAFDIQKIDMLSIPYAAGSFDFVIANHVLEHVSGAEAALSEVQRVLKVGGLAILQTPYSPKLVKTFSDPGIDTTQARRQAYGQEDHVRLFGMDIFTMIESVGFSSRVVRHNEVLNDFDARRFGTNADEPFFLFERLS